MDQKMLNIKSMIWVLMAVLSLAPMSAMAKMNHQKFSHLLSDYVEAGRIRFTPLCEDSRLDDYLAELDAVNLDDVSDRDAEFALWLNAYNAYSLQVICQEYPIESINDLHTGGLVMAVMFKNSIWDQPIVKVAGQTYTLREMDHELLRPTFKDPRIQFALACGAVGCAPAREEAYQADKIDQQLEDQARRFINDQRINTFDVTKKRARISPLFKWSRKDFGGSYSNVLFFMAQYLPDDLRTSITDDPKSWKITFRKYDLTLNDETN